MNKHRKILTSRSPFKFFLIVFALSIPLWVIETFINIKALPLDIPITDILAAFTPFLAASMIVYYEEGRLGMNNLFRRIWDSSRITKKSWYLPVFFLPFLMYLLIYITLYITGLPLPMKFHMAFLSIPFLFILFFIGAVAEETGYMGYAIDPMQKKFGALSASVLMGIPWAIWHYPSIIQQGHNFTWIAWGTLGTVTVRVLIVWIYNNTGRSLFACILFHTMLNIGRPLFPHDETHSPLVDYPSIHYSIIAITALFVCFFWDSKTLSTYRYKKKTSLIIALY